MSNAANNVIDLGHYKVRVVGEAKVAHYEWSLIEAANQKRLEIARKTEEASAADRSELNRIDHSIAQFSGELERARYFMRERDEATHQKPHGWVYYTLALGVLLALEIPVNKAALDFLEMQESASWALGGGIALVNLIAARSTGRWLRQLGQQDRPWKHYLLMIATNGALFAALFGAATMRSQMSAGDGGMFAGLVFFTLQLAFYLAAAGLSFLQTPPDAAIEQLDKRIEKLRAQLDKLWQARNVIAKRVNARLAEARRAIQILESDARERVAQYRDGNLAKRARMGGHAAAAPAFIRQAVPQSALIPVVLGEFVDAHPQAIAQTLDADR